MVGRHNTACAYYGLAGTGNIKTCHECRFKLTTERDRLKTRCLCFDAPPMPCFARFLGKADKQLPACLAALKHAFYAVVKIYT